MGYSFRLAERVLLYASSHRLDSTYHRICFTSRGALAGMRNSSMRDRSDDLSISLFECVFVFLGGRYGSLGVSLFFNIFVGVCFLAVSFLLFFSSFFFFFFFFLGGGGYLFFLKYNNNNTNAILLFQLFLIPASAPRLVYQGLRYVLSCLWDGVYKRTLAANRKE